MDGGNRNNQAYNLPLLTTYGGYDAPDPWCKYLCSKQDTRTQEHQDKGELVANCDQLQNDEVVVTTPVESRIMSIRGKQIMIEETWLNFMEWKPGR